MVDTLTLLAACTLAINYGPISASRGPCSDRIVTDDAIVTAGQSRMPGRRIQDGTVQCAAGLIGGSCGRQVVHFADATTLEKPAGQVAGSTPTSGADQRRGATMSQPSGLALPPLLRAMQDGDQENQQRDSAQIDGALSAHNCAPNARPEDGDHGRANKNEEGASVAEPDSSSPLFVPLRRDRASHTR